MMNGQSVGEPSEKIGVIPCSKRVEPGLFFFPGNGSNLFKAGEEINTNKRLNRNRYRNKNRNKKSLVSSLSWQ